jgi:hypothetical protein
MYSYVVANLFYLTRKHHRASLTLLPSPPPLSIIYTYEDSLLYPVKDMLKPDVSLEITHRTREMCV